MNAEFTFMADDKKLGFSVNELLAILRELPSDAIVRIQTGLRGQPQRLTAKVSGDKAETDG